RPTCGRWGSNSSSFGICRHLGRKLQKRWKSASARRANWWNLNNPKSQLHLQRLVSASNQCAKIGRKRVGNRRRSPDRQELPPADRISLKVAQEAAIRMSRDLSRTRKKAHKNSCERFPFNFLIFAITLKPLRSMW